MIKTRWLALFWISVSVLFALSLWFSVSAIVPELREMLHLNTNTEIWMTASVQIGFITGSFISAYFGISDRYNTRKIFAVSAFFGAVINGLFILVDHALPAIILRLLTGMALSGVYPTAVKLVAEWFPRKRGLSIGILIAALTLGSALPHFIILFLSSFNWKSIIIASSVLAFTSSLIMIGVLEDASNSTQKTHFSFQLIHKVFVNKPVMLANYGYFGHMWELYAMWTWLPVFLNASFAAYSTKISPWFSALSSFISIGVAGAIGSIVGGYYADKIGRARLTIIAMLVSACCSVVIGFTFGHSPGVVLLISFIWGMSVIADSAQYSAAVSEFSEVEYLGTALTLQMAVGFLITIFSINLIPLVQKHIGWTWGFAFLSIGPVLGILSMLKLEPYEGEGRMGYNHHFTSRIEKNESW